MNTRHLRTSYLTFSLSALLVGALPAAEQKEVEFNRDIRPILSANCFACHGPDKEARKAKLRLDTAEGARADRGGYAAIVPGKADDSELMTRIGSDDPEEVMPPPKHGEPLPPVARELLRRWIESGADYQVHWSFVPPKKVALPQVQQKDWPISPLDHFVLAKLEENRLSPSAPADRARLIRRVSLDLTGLPPTPEDADAFAGDRGEDAYAKVVDRLLASEAFGERWARMWLDLARYADTKGYEKDRPRAIWRYRDWVIDSLNRDMPYDQFTIEQLAGDLLPQATSDQFLATAFHRNTMENDEGGTDDEEFRVAAVKDRVDTTVQVWMGLTMGCAKCHSHKYDPISHEDYYAFYAFFNQTEDADREGPVLPTPTAEQSERIAKLDDEAKALERRLTEKPEGFAQAFAEWKALFEGRPLWRPLVKSAFESKRGVTLEQGTDGTLVAGGEQPDKDTWILTLDLLAGESVTALRIDALPKKPGGKWKDKNVALRELTVELLEPGEKPRRLKLTNPRADFSQKNWEVARAIDGKPEAGWAFSPKAAEPHVAVFDFATPIAPQAGRQLRLTLDQEYGKGLLFERFRISASPHPAKWLSASIDPAAGLEAIFMQHQYPATVGLQAKLEATRKALAAEQKRVPKTPVMRELAANKQRKTQIHTRGNFLDPGEAVAARLPSVFGNLADGVPQNRLGVAQWIVQAENPLTARVAVNRTWARLFGIGIVETEEDFGAQGTPPSHPELLDWLAIDFRENGWSFKKLLRTIVLSSTYRQSSVVTPELLAADPRNRLLSRGARFRLSAETMRDQALVASGLLTRKLGGPSVMPPQPPGVWKSTYSGEKWKNAEGPDRYRRGLYTYLKRTSPYPAMTTFDAGSGEVCQIRRVRTNTPLQALVILNDPAYVEAAGALSKRMTSIEHGFRLVLTRPPSSKELDRLNRLYQSLKADFSADPDAANELLKSARLENGDAAMVAVASVILNLDETLMKP